MVINLNIDIVIPIFNEAKSVYDNISEIHRALCTDSISHRFILVDDGSTDGTWKEIIRLDISQTTALRLSRNFGKEAAVCAGLTKSSSDACVVMDCDLQHPPQMIKVMLDKRKEGYPIVECVKVDRGRENVVSRAFAKLFYLGFRKMSGFDFDNSSDYKLIDKSVIEAWKEMGDTNVFFRGMIEWVGYEKCRIPFAVAKRSGGSSSFSRLRLLRLALTAITSFSSKPLMITNIIGLLFFLGAVILTMQTLANKYAGMAQSGFTTVIILQLLIGSLILFCIGIIGMYIARIFDEVKGRPRYVVREIFRCGS